MAQHRVVWAYRGIFYKDNIFFVFCGNVLTFCYILFLYIFIILIVNGGNYKIKVKLKVS